MTIHLPEDLERYIRSQVQAGNFVSEDDAISEAVRLLRQQRQSNAATPPPPLSEQEFEQWLTQSGHMRSVPACFGPRPPFQPITIQGEPLSETVIRERR